MVIHTRIRISPILGGGSRGVLEKLSNSLSAGLGGKGKGNGRNGSLSEIVCPWVSVKERNENGLCVHESLFQQMPYQAGGYGVECIRQLHVEGLEKIYYYR